MVTLPERREMMARAVQAWTRQTHPERELIVVIDQGRAAERDRAATMITALGRSDIKTVVADSPLSLGALRNLSVAHASGDLVCLWDDDDLHHPHRIARQVAAMSRADCAATVLQEVMLYRAGPRTLHWTNWAATPAGGLPGTLMCRRANMPGYAESGPTARLGEDLDLLQRLRASHGVHLQAGEPHLYVYVTHGANSHPPDHHAMLARSLSISKALLLRREAGLRDGLRPFGFDGVSVEGPNGRAFSL
jgi:glycosyltransferase involved in cell wall biosynthesis